MSLVEILEKTAVAAGICIPITLGITVSKKFSPLSEEINTFVIVAVTSSLLEIALAKTYLIIKYKIEDYNLKKFKESLPPASKTRTPSKLSDNFYISSDLPDNSPEAMQRAVNDQIYSEKCTELGFYSDDYP